MQTIRIEQPWPSSSITLEPINVSTDVLTGNKMIKAIK